VADSLDVDAKLASAAKVISATYLHPYNMHGSLGASAAVADVKVEVRNPANTAVVIVDQANYPPQVPASTVNYEAAFMVNIADAFATPSESIGSTLTNLQVACKDDGLCDYHPSPGVLSTYTGTAMAGQWQICAWDVESGDPGGSFVVAELAFTGS